MNETQAPKGRHSLNKKIYSQEERRNYCLAWERSKLSHMEFCKNHGISRSALYQWLKEFKKAPDAHTKGFSALVLTSKAAAQEKSMIDLTISFTNDNPIQLSLTLPEHQFISLLQEIGYATSIIR